MATVPEPSPSSTRLMPGDLPAVVPATDALGAVKDALSALEAAHMFAYGEEVIKVRRAALASAIALLAGTDHASRALITRTLR